MLQGKFFTRGLCLLVATGCGPAQHTPSAERCAAETGPLSDICWLAALTPEEAPDAERAAAHCAHVHSPVILDQCTTAAATTLGFALPEGQWLCTTTLRSPRAAGEFSARTEC